MNKHQIIALVVLLLAGFVTIFDLFVVNVAIVSIEKSLNANLTELTLIIVGYELAFGLLLITGGRLGDIYGKRTLYRLGMVFFVISSALCAVAPTAGILVLARCIQGLSAALLFPQVYSSIHVNFEGAQAKKAFGYLGMTLGLAAIAGQALGGWLITMNVLELGWRMIFLINIPIGAVAIGLSHYLYEGKKLSVNLDWYGVVLSSIGIAMVLFPLLMLPIWGWTWLCSGLLLMGSLILLLFIVWERKLERANKVPLLSIQLLFNKAYVVGLFTVLCVYATSSAFPLLTSILLQRGFGLTPLDSGLIFVPASIGFVLSSLLTPKWTNCLGDKVIVGGAIGYGLSYLLFIGLLFIVTPTTNLNIITPALFLIGFTQGMIMTPMLNLILSRVNSTFSGMASGVMATLQQVGAALGATVASVIMQYSLLASSYENAFLQLKASVINSLYFNMVMASCAGLLLWCLVNNNKKLKV
ncbi:MFS transporter [Providencia huaxiensis]|uniref:MFS transporter n=1 Tax=Providencia huaxiensis TaxID=2027290 RepID=UPI003D2E38F3